MEYQIYKITNIVNNKCYVGQTRRNLPTRMAEHVSRAKHNCKWAITYAIRKYGAENFSIHSLDLAEDRNLANWLESLYIGLLRANQAGYGYNMTAGGEGVEHTPEIRAKISAALTGKPLSIESRAKLKGNKNASGHKNSLGLKHSVEAKARIGAAQTGKIMSPETREKIRLSMLGKKNALGWRKYKDA
jgi:group I intron endonuclease